MTEPKGFPLGSPWALAVHDGYLYIAMAGPSGVDDLGLAFSPELDASDRIDFSTLAPAARVSGPCVPTIAVPTTSGTASETDGGGLITRSEDHRKLTFSHPDVKPRVVVLDPLLTAGLPPGATAACGMDVLTHAVEAFTSTAANAYAVSVSVAGSTATVTITKTGDIDPGDAETLVDGQSLAGDRRTLLDNKHIVYLMCVGVPQAGHEVVN